MASSSNRFMPITHKPRQSKKPPASTTRHTARIEKSSSTPNSPGQLQLRKIHGNNISALENAARLQFYADDSRQSLPVAFPASNLGLRRPMSWHPVAQKSATWDSYHDSFQLPHSSPLISTPISHDDIHGGLPHHYTSQTPFGWSAYSQSATPHFNAFPYGVSSTNLDVLPYTASPALGHDGHDRHDVDQLAAPYMPYSTFEGFGYPSDDHYGAWPFQPSFNMLQSLQPGAVIPSNKLYPTSPFESDTKSCGEESPGSTMTPFQNQKSTPPDDGELVGMGLYDEPENMSSWDPQSDQYQSLLFHDLKLDNGPGKGWKLEETFQPKTDACDAEQDTFNSQGNDNHQSSSARWDFDEFVPMPADEIVPQYNFNALSMYHEHDETFHNSFAIPSFYAGAHNLVDYSST